MDGSISAARPGEEGRRATRVPPAWCGPPCPVQATPDVIGGGWKPMILYQLCAGPLRFNALRRVVPGVTQRTLTAHLRELERDGIVRRTAFPEVPPRVEYALTPLGESLGPVLEGMAAWGERYAAARGPAPG